MSKVPKASRDSAGHRRFSLKQALKNHPMSAKQIIEQVPVYRAELTSQGDAQAYDKFAKDLRALRALGNLITTTQDASGETLYVLDDSMDIEVDTAGCDLTLLFAVLDRKAQTSAGVLTQSGVRKLLVGGETHDTNMPVLTSSPRGTFIPQIAAAIAHRCTLEFSYAARVGSANDYSVEPWRIELHDGDFYLLASKLDEKTGKRAGFRRFKVERMTSVKVRYDQRSAGVPSNLPAPFFEAASGVFSSDAPHNHPLIVRSRETDSGASRVLPPLDRYDVFDDFAFYGVDARLLGPQPLAQEFLDRLRYVESVLTHENLQAREPKPQRTGSDAVTPRSEYTPALDPSIERREALYQFVLSRGEVTLGEVARHFALDRQKALQELREIYTTEVFNGWEYESLYDLEFDVDQLDGPASDDLVVRAWGVPEQFNRAGFSLAEIVSTVGTIDSLLVMARGQIRASLLDLRARLTSAVDEAGLGHSLWEATISEPPAGVYENLVAAITRRRLIRFRYWRISATPPCARPVEVLAAPLIIDASGTLAATSHPLLVAVPVRESETDLSAYQVADVRHYRLDRITDIELTNQRFAAKAARHLLGASVDAQPEYSDNRVTLRLAKSGRWVAEQVPQAVVEDAGDGVLVSFPVRDTTWLRALLVRIGPELFDLQPRSVAASIAEQIHEILAHYESDGGAGEEAVQ